MRKLTATCAALALALAAGCGGDEEGEPIPRDDAAALLEQLDGIERQVDAGRCGSASFQVRGDGELQDKIAALPAEVDADVRSALEDGADRLLELIEDQCGEDEEQDTNTVETDTEPTETDAPRTVPQDTGTQPTETQPPQTETQPPQTETTPPPDEGEPPLPEPDGGGAPAPGADGGAGAGPGSTRRGTR